MAQSYSLHVLSLQRKHTFTSRKRDRPGGGFHPDLRLDCFGTDTGHEKQDHYSALMGARRRDAEETWRFLRLEKGLVQPDLEYSQLERV